MIDELRLIQEIVGDLSAAGGWIAGGYIGYRFIVTMTTIVGFIWLAAYVVRQIAEHLKAAITRHEADRIILQNSRLECEKEDLKAAHRTELEKIKHLYKILKESKNAE